MKPVLPFLNKYRKILFFLILPVIAIVGLSILGYCQYASYHRPYVYGSGFLEQQRKLWNDYMDQSPRYLFNSAYEDEPQLFSEATTEKIHTIKEEISTNLQENGDTYEWKVMPPEKVDLEILPFGGMTEKELLSLPEKRKNLEYYAELLSRFRLDDAKVMEILQSMKQQGIEESNVLLALHTYKSIYPGLGKPEIDIVKNFPLVPGFQQYKETISSGNYPAHIMLKICGWNSDSAWLEEMERNLRLRALKGDPVAQRQLANIILDLLSLKYSQSDTKKNWLEIEQKKGITNLACQILPNSYADTLKEWSLKLSPRRKLIRQLPEWPRLEEALEWYRKAADSGDLEAMYAWTRGSFNFIPRYLSKEDWTRMMNYYTTLYEKGDWRLFLHMNYNWMVTLDYLPTVFSSGKDRNQLRKNILKLYRHSGSLPYQQIKVSRNGLYQPLLKRNNLPLFRAMNSISPYKAFNFFCLSQIFAPSPPSILAPLKEMIEKNTEQQSPVFLYALAWMYEYGLGCEKDYSKAAQLQEKAYLAYDLCYRNMVPLSSDYADSAQVPLTYAIPAKIIELNMNPDYAGRNPSRAFELATLFQDYNRRSVYSNQVPTETVAPTFSCYLGKMYEQGIGTPKDISKALACYKKGIEQKNPHCLIEMGRCYEQGTGVTADKKKAIEYYDQALNNCPSRKLSEEIKKRKSLLQN